MLSVSLIVACRWRTGSALRPDTHDWVDGEGIVLSRQLLEGLDELPVGHLAVHRLPPHDETGEAAPLFVPLVRPRFLASIVRDQDSPLLYCTLEVRQVLGPFDQLIDGADDVPAGISECSDEGAMDVGVCVERESPATYLPWCSARALALRRSYRSSVPSSSASSASISSLWSW